MGLTEEERARLNDSKHKIQSVANSLTHVDPRKVPDFDEIEKQLAAAIFPHVEQCGFKLIVSSRASVRSRQTE